MQQDAGQCLRLRGIADVFIGYMYLFISCKHYHITQTVAARAEGLLKPLGHFRQSCFIPVRGDGLLQLWRMFAAKEGTA